MAGLTASVAVNCAETLVDDDEELSVVQVVASEVVHSTELGAVVAQLREQLTKSPQTCVQNFLHVTVPNYSLLQFRQHFRISRSCFEVCTRLAMCIEYYTV